MSAVPAFVMGTLCIVGGVTGYARTQFICPLVAGVSFGALYLYSGESIRKHTANGLETALGTSAVLVLSSIPMFTKSPIPALLAVTSAATGAYYGNTIYNLRQN